VSEKDGIVPVEISQRDKLLFRYPKSILMVVEGEDTLATVGYSTVNVTEA
jgi:hypothetical protein